MNDNNIFAGLNGFVWWVGVIENRKDPLNLCRCQIRVFGWHTEDKSLIPTKDLPWAQPVFPVNDANKPKTPMEGDWVVGFFFDGPSGQVPVFFGVLPGIPVPYMNNPQKGFSDSRTEDDLKSAPAPLGESPQRYPKTIGEPTTSRLYRNENIEKTIINKINSSLTKSIPTTDGKSWDEPKLSYAAVPPYNDVKETESGHYMEFDDTPNAERINITHRTGTYTEIRPDGSKVNRIVGKNYEVVAGDDYLNIKGNCNITVNGNANVKVLKNVKMEVSGNFDAEIGGHCYIDSKGNMKLTAPRIDFNPD